MQQKNVHRLCVFSDPRFGDDPRFRRSAVALGRAMATAGIRLVFAGAAAGTTGLLVQAVRQHGGFATGVTVPPPRECGGMSGCIVGRHEAADHQERKRLMFRLADGFIALPGGPGVLDALMEHLTWMQRGLPPKPVYLVNTGGYWHPLLRMFARMRGLGFLPPTFGDRYVVVDDPTDAVADFERRWADGQILSRHLDLPGAGTCTAPRQDRSPAVSDPTGAKGMRAGRLCVYCGSSPGSSPLYKEKAKELGAGIAAAGLRLVYGGGGSGLMGAVARAARQGGGHVTGIIPQSLLQAEQVLDDVDECIVVDHYHKRKSLMLDLSDGFAAFPGGPGTLEELAEQLAWAECGHHDKPIYLVNVGGYWNECLAMLDGMREMAFTTPDFGTRYTVVDEPGELVSLFAERWRQGCGPSG